jgi:hypothetical protein
MQLTSKKGYLCTIMKDLSSIALFALCKRRLPCFSEPGYETKDTRGAFTWVAKKNRIFQSFIQLGFGPSIGTCVVYDLYICLGFLSVPYLLCLIELFLFLPSHGR